MFLFGLGVIVGYHAHKYRSELLGAELGAAAAEAGPIPAPAEAPAESGSRRKVRNTRRS